MEELESSNSTLTIDPMLDEIVREIDSDAARRDIESSIKWILVNCRGSGLIEVCQYFGYRFRWAWMKEYLEVALNGFRQDGDLRRVRAYEVMLEAFEDDWEDVDFFPSLQ